MPEPILKPVPEPKPEPTLTPVPAPKPKPTQEVALKPVPRPKITPAPAPRVEPRLDPIPEPPREPKLAEVAPPRPRIRPAPMPKLEPKLAPAPRPQPKPDLAPAPRPAPRPSLDPAPKPAPKSKGGLASGEIKNVAPIRPKVIGSAGSGDGSGNGVGQGSSSGMGQNAGSGSAAAGGSTYVTPTEQYGDIGAYHGHLFDVFNGVWRRPGDIQSAGRQLRVRVQLTIARDGDVLGAEVIQSSGHPEMDESVRSALLKVQKVDPTPDFIKKLPFSVILNFDI